MLILGIVALIALITVAYPIIQDRRERRLAERLREIHDPRLAVLEVDQAREKSRLDAGFIRAIANYIRFR